MTAEEKVPLPAEAATGPQEPEFKTLSSKGKCKHVLEHAGLQKKQPSAESLEKSTWYYIKHVGYNNIEITEGMDGKGKLAYFIDVKARIVGWDVTVRRPNGDAVLHLRKDITLMRLLGWDKGSNVDVSDLSDGSSSGQKPTVSQRAKELFHKAKDTRKTLLESRRSKVEGEPAEDDIILPEVDEKTIQEMDDKTVTELPAQKITSITRQHAMRSNENLFDFEGRTYAWNYWIAIGSTLRLTDVATKEVLAVVQLRPTWRIQMITSWSWRLDGTLEMKPEVKERGMEDILIATLTAMLEWRKHNNKYWIIAAAIA